MLCFGGRRGVKNVKFDPKIRIKYSWKDFICKFFKIKIETFFTVSVIRVEIFEQKGAHFH